MGQQSKNSCSKPMTFRLPVPLRTTDIRIYPDQWSGEPLLHVNFLTCSLEGQTCVEPLLTGGGKLQRLQFDNMDEQLVDKNSMFYITIKFKKHAISRIKAVQFSQGPKDNSITKFVLQYLGNSEKWNSVSDKDGEIMMFSTDTIVKKSYPTTVFFSKPVIAKSMRIYPETWQGLSPMIKIEFLGCTLKH
ncbi:unnamed protein product [Mytilus coruscus]|uniref:F5/8 type C domain-containing protein n=1 Tax=Mytilus coruscus TaxID=42192 RepID=A0A6J8CFR6_MYTCO|nr:unnamed protein product [Mytilus coruscus]